MSPPVCFQPKSKLMPSDTPSGNKTGNDEAGRRTNGYWKGSEAFWENLGTQMNNHLWSTFIILCQLQRRDLELSIPFNAKMQMRFDGTLGFPGGLMDPGETPVQCLNRELYEEIGLNLTKHSFSDNEHVASYFHEGKNLVLHFYIKEVSAEEFCDLEANTLKAAEYGIETLGIIRVPLFTMGDGLRGFPAFLTNHFAGNAKSELITGLLAAKLFTEEEMEEALKVYRDFIRK
ncbi:U8 snorna-decapping enzyme [Plakobranchus ocellatus]|uniref:U8 snoRNA-decapping enzyme n=1 Tax=Plakobranchus ocellatus TaxID=259542 RepID=A0AAV4DEV2_9GAST|nr:U8 snorna-decapping enzyme [Plakobranchus ocellatus]